MRRAFGGASLLVSAVFGCSLAPSDRWRGELLSSNLDTRWTAAAEIIAHPSKDRALLPAIVESWTLDAGVMSEFGPIQAFTLASFGPEILPDLVALLRDPTTRSLALFALLAMKAVAADVAPSLLQLLRSADPDLRRAALVALSETAGARAEPGGPLLAAMLEDPDAEIRGLAARALGRIGPAAGFAARAMAQRVQVERNSTWSAFAGALGDLKDAATPALPLLVEALSSPDPNVRERALEAFTEIGHVAATELPKILPALSDPEGDVRWKAVEAVSASGIETPDVIRALGQALLDPVDLRVRASAAVSLAHLKRPPIEALLPLITTLRTRDPEEAKKHSSQIEARRWAAKAVGRLGPAAHEAVPALIDLCSDKSVYVRTRAAEALGLVGKAAAPALPALRLMRENGADWEKRVAEEAAQLISSSLR